MPEPSPQFDPYHKWLGIAPKYRPLTHYRLLGLEEFEADMEVIEAGAERQMTHLQTYKIGPFSELSQRLLNEIAKARVCLLNPTSKAAYDQELRRRVTQAAADPGAEPQASLLSQGAASVAEVSPRDHVERDRFRALIVLSGAAAMIAIVALVLFTNSRSIVVAPEQAIVAAPSQNKIAAEEERLASSAADSAKENDQPIAELPEVNNAVPAPDHETSSSVDDHPSAIAADSVPDTAPQGIEDELPSRRVPPAAEDSHQDPSPHRAALPSPPFSHQTFPAITLPIGGVIRASRLLRTPEQIKAVFEKPEQRKPSTENGSWTDGLYFTFIDPATQTPIGLFGFDDHCMFRGPALVLGDNGRPSFLFNYGAGQRDGQFRSWDEEGNLRLYGEFSNNGKVGMTCYLEKTGPVRIDEWGKTKNRRTFFIERKGTTAVAFVPNRYQRVPEKETKEAQSSIERDIATKENDWKSAFAPWWQDVYSQLDPLLARVEDTQGTSEQAQAEAKLAQTLSRLKSASDKNRDAVLSRF